MRCARAIVELLVSTSAYTPYTKHTQCVLHIPYTTYTISKHIHHTLNTQSHGGSVLPPTLQSLSQVQPSSASVCVCQVEDQYMTSPALPFTLYL